MTTDYMYVIFEEGYTVEPLNKGHVGASNFVYCREVVRSSEVQNVLTIWRNEHVDFVVCPLLRGYFHCVLTS